MKLIFENWRRFLNEVEFYDQQPDYDKMPGAGKSVVVFDVSDNYSKEGLTHGGMSHSIKHYAEFNAPAVNAAVKKANSIVQKFDNVFIKKANQPDVVNQGDEAKQIINQNPMILLNTFDLINDKALQGDGLRDSEQKLLPIIQNIYSEYKKLAEKQLSAAVDVDKVSDANQIGNLLEGGKIIRFTATYGKSKKSYAFNAADTAIISYMQGKISTFFKIDKAGVNKQKALRYLTKGIEIKNPAVLEALQNWAGPAEQPQQQQQKKKEKPQREKQKSKPGDVVKRLKQAGRGDDQIRQILSKAFPKLPERAVDNMITNIKP